MKKLVVSLILVLGVSVLLPAAQAAETPEVLPASECGAGAQVAPARAGVLTNAANNEDWYDASFEEGAREFTLMTTDPLAGVIQGIVMRAWEWDPATGICSNAPVESVFCSVQCTLDGGANLTLDEPGDYQLQLRLGTLLPLPATTNYVVTVL